MWFVGMLVGAVIGGIGNGGGIVIGRARVLDTGSRIEGKVVEKDTGQPVADVLLWLEPASVGAFRGTEPTKSGADGTFHFTSLAAGSYRVRAGFGTNALPDWVAEIPRAASIANCVSTESVMTPRCCNPLPPTKLE